MSNFTVNKVICFSYNSLSDSFYSMNYFLEFEMHRKFLQLTHILLLPFQRILSISYAHLHSNPLDSDQVIYEAN